MSFFSPEKQGGGKGTPEKADFKEKIFLNILGFKNLTYRVVSINLLLLESRFPPA